MLVNPISASLKGSRTIVLLAALMFACAAAQAQLHWAAYDASGNLVSFNAGSGGDATSASAVNLDIPAGQQLIFVTTNFAALDLSAGGTLATVDFVVSVSGGLTGAGGYGNPRVLGVGLFNTAGTGGTSDDAGYFSLWNAGGPYPECYLHASGANLFSGTQQGQGGSYTGSLADAATYDALVRLVNNGGNIAMGNGSSLANAGIAYQGAGVDLRAYINPVAPPGGYTVFDEFAVMFHNQSGGDVTLTLSNLALVPLASPPPAATQAVRYNVQLNGLGTTFAGAAQTGEVGDVWNKPALSNIDGTGNTNSRPVVTGAPLVDSSGAASAVTLSVSALNYKGFTASAGSGSPVSGLNNQALKFDWNGAQPVPTVTINLAGLPANAAVGLFAYGAGYYSSTAGSTWTVDAANGGAVATCGYGDTYAGTNSTGLNVKLSSSRKLGWDLAEAITDGGGNLQVVVTPVDTSYANRIWWQTYMNGFQLQVYEAPTVSNLVDQTVIEGNAAVLSADITGVPVPHYQWQENGVNLPGETNATLNLANVQYSQDGNAYSLIASNPAGAATNSMTLGVIVTPSITGLDNQALAPGGTVVLSPVVGGVPAPSLYWQRDGVDLMDGATGNGSTVAGSATDSLSITNAQEADSGTYSLIASNSAGMITNSMSLIVSSVPVAPQISGPTDQTVVEGDDATFTASVVGLPAPTLQWLEDGSPLPGETNASLTISGTTFAQDGNVYSLVAGNPAGFVTNSATLTVYFAPMISAQPQSLTVTNGDPVSFSVGASGSPAVTYLWRKNGSPVGTDSDTYSVGSVTPAGMGSYSVIITNAVGSITSAVATLTVNSTMSVTAVSPTNGATGVFYDTPLTVTFSQPVALGTVGSIKIYAATNGTTPVDTLNVALGSNQQRTFPGDGQTFNYPTVVISGNGVTIHPHFNTLSSNQTYYVTIDNGAFKDAAGAWFAGLSDTNAWRFTTKPGGPADPSSLVVAADGSGDFLTVQGAVNAVPGGNTTPTLIHVRDGLYREIVNISGRHNVTLRGQSRLGTRIGYPNNDSLNGTTHARMSFKVNANDIAIESLTLTNMTAQGGSQAEALMIESGARRCIINNADIVSRQDTILANEYTSQAYFHQSTIRGNFDYIWGGGNLYFDDCNIHTISGTGGPNLSAARTSTSSTTSTNFPWSNPGGTYTANGMSFVRCLFTSDPGVGGITLAGGNGTAGNLVSWALCRFQPSHANPSSGLFGGNYLFWQHGNSNLVGGAVSYPTLTTLTNNDSRLLAATNVVTWLYGWTPKLLPNILTNPVSQSVAAGNPVEFTVSATGIPAPTYQWKRAGTNLNGATNATLTLPSAQSDDAGAYQVEVSNTAGTVLSATAVLTVTPVSPVPIDIEANADGGYLNLSWPEDHTGWTLQAQTNGLDIGLDTTWYTLGYADTNAVSLPINPASPSVFYRLIYQLP